MTWRWVPHSECMSDDPVVRIQLPKPRRSAASNSESDFKLPRLMQRVGAEPGKTPTTTSWFEDSHSTFRHHAEYLNRLRKLRQDLIDHEQSKLTNALERFRLKDTESTFYFGQRIPGRAVFRLHAHNALPARSNSQTTEKLRRSKEETPRLETVQGRQLIEPQDKQKEEQAPNHRVSLDRHEIDSTVRENLKRLLQPQPTCSIPNIGRRSLKQPSEGKHVSSELTIKSPRATWMKRSKTHNKFPLASGLRGSSRLTRPDSDELDLSPRSYKFERLRSRSKLQKVQEGTDGRSYNVFYVASTPESEVSNSHQCEKCGKIIRRRAGTTDTKSSAETYTSSYSENCTCSHGSSAQQQLTNGAQGSPRRRIVVDMPDIVLNPATPDLQTPPVDKGGQLSKTLRQNQLRQREISNLLEDVKEISNRTESLENSFSESGS